MLNFGLLDSSTWGDHLSEERKNDMNMNMDPNAMSSPWFTSAADPNYPSMQQQQYPSQMGGGMGGAPSMHQQQPQRFQSPPGSSGGGISGTVGSSYTTDPDDDDYTNEPPLLEGMYLRLCIVRYVTWVRTLPVFGQEEQDANKRAFMWCRFFCAADRAGHQL